MSIPAFGAVAEVEVRDLPAATAAAAIEEALAEIHQLDILSDPDGTAPDGVGALNRTAGQGPLEIDPRLAELLLRSLQFCIWSSGSYGPLGGELDRLWQQRQETRRPPPAGALRNAVYSAECNRLELENDNPSASENPARAVLATGSRVSLDGIARGFAIDRAMEILERHGSGNAWIEIGPVWRARGPGPEGRGWLAVLPPVPGEDEPLDQIWLHDQTLVLLDGAPLSTGEHRPIMDQRTGVPAQGVVMVATVSELAVDAEPLATTLFILGQREGQLRLGTLKPRPAVYWLLGEGEGRPLEATYRWSSLERVRRRR